MNAYLFQKKSVMWAGYAVLCTVILLLAMFVGTRSAHAEMLSRQLSFGMSGSDVSALQTYLASDPSIYPQGLITGYFGTLTRAAVMRFQNAHSIPAVGRVGPITLAALNSLMGSTPVSGSAAQISNVSVTTTSNSAHVMWDTDKNAYGTVYYSASPLVVTEAPVGTSDVSVSGAQARTDSSLHTSQNVLVDGLSSGTTYYYAIVTRDASGNVQMTWPQTFRTR